LYAEYKVQQKSKARHLPSVNFRIVLLGLWSCTFSLGCLYEAFAASPFGWTAALINY
jgi:hypothetical protein